MGNTKAIDLVAVRGSKKTSIQVKAIARKQNVGWPLPHDQSKIEDGVIYVCVILNGIDEAPTYYVLPPEEVKKRGQWFNTRAILRISSLKDGKFKGKWKLIDAELKAPTPISA